MTDSIQSTPTVCQALCQSLGTKQLTRQAQAPKGQKTDKQVISTECDEANDLLAPGGCTQWLGGGVGGRGHFSPYPLLWGWTGSV